MLQQIKKSAQILLATLALAAVPALAMTALPQSALAAESTLPIFKQGEIIKNKENPNSGKLGCYATGRNLNSSNCGIIKVIVVATNILTGIAGTVIVIMIIVGGIQYTSAGPNPQKVAAAKGKITNALIALFVLVFFYSFLQWLVPGGVF